jgi:hypothetical protein
MEFGSQRLFDKANALNEDQVALPSLSYCAKPLY